MNDIKRLEKDGVIRWSKLHRCHVRVNDGKRLTKTDLKALCEAIKGGRFPIKPSGRSLRKRRSFSNKAQREEMFDRENFEGICEVEVNFKKLWKNLSF